MSDVARPVVYVQGVRNKGDVYLGCGPKTGCPVDAEGRLILVNSYGRPTSAITAQAPTAPPSPPAEPKVSRGVATPEQRSLI